MKLNLFRRKAAKNDYTPDMLPKNRKEVFFDVLKLHWKELFLLGLILLLFSLPFLFSQLLQDRVTFSVMRTLTDSSSDEEIIIAYKKIAATENIRAYVNVIFLMFYSFGFSGVVRVVRQFAWEENVCFGAEFLKGVKQNLGQNSLTAFVGGMIYALCVGIFNMASVSSGLTRYLLYLPIGISLLAIFPVLAYLISETCVYATKWRQNIKTGFFIYVKNAFQTLLALVCCAVIYIPQFIPNVYCHIIGRILSPLLTPFLLLAWLLFSFNQFDKHINAKFYPSIVGKGLHSDDTCGQSAQDIMDKRK